MRGYIIAAAGVIRLNTQRSTIFTVIRFEIVNDIQKNTVRIILFSVCVILFKINTHLL